MTGDARRLRWEERTRVPFLVLAFVYLIGWTVVAVDARILSPLSIVATLVLVAIWITFIVDYVVRLRLAEDRGWFVVHHLADLLAVVLPSLRPLVQLRHLNALPLFRSRTGAAQRFRIGLFAVVFAIIFIYTVSLAVLVAERRDPHAVILTLGDALWWACVTIFTVGYGDLYPVTAVGRIWSVVLMIGGVAIIGVASAIVVSYLNERIQRHPLERDDGADPEGPTPPTDTKRT